MLVRHAGGVCAEPAHGVAVMYAGGIVEIGPVRRIVDRPSHPYTKGLMASIPRTAGPRGRLRQIDGTMPRLNAIPPGRPFSPPGTEALDRCRRARPDLMPPTATQPAGWQ